MDGFERKPALLFEVSDKPIVEADWSEQYRKTRHGLDSDKHVMIVETDPEYPDDRDVSIEHPAQCPDDAACEFDDFEHDDIDGQEDGRFFVAMAGAYDYWGEYDSEFVVRGPVT